MRDDWIMGALASSMVSYIDKFIAELIITR